MLRFCTCLLGGLLIAATPASGAAVPNRARSADDMTKRVDSHIDSGWKRAGVEPAKLADDSEFVRRVYLDLAGRIPTVSESRAFLADKRSDRRTRLVEKLLAGPRFVTHFTTIYRTLLLPEANSNFNVRFQVPAFEGWLAEWLESGAGLDVMVRNLVEMPIGAQQGGFRLGGGGQGSPAPFYSAKDFAPEELAGAVSRLFLGVNLSCAQCHNHPFANWKRDQFWSFAAFFSGIKSQRQGDFVQTRPEVPDDHEIAIPNTDKKVKAKFLDGKEPTIKKGTRSRVALADWLVSKDNPYFARAAVNRLWAHFFGTGLVEPLDEMVGTESKASHPELLDELAKGFGENKFDLRWLVRVITSSKAYQLSSLRTNPVQDDPKLFARMHLRGLTPEQLFDSLATATGYVAQDGRNFDGGARQQFLTKFSNAADRPTEVQTSILQALALMNGQVTAQATSLERSETLAALVDAPFMTTAEKIEALYLASVNRPPSPKEISRLVRYVEGGGTSTAKEKSKRRAEALADVFWALLNSGEFKFNH